MPASGRSSAKRPIDMAKKKCRHEGGYYLKDITSYDQHYDWNHFAVGASDPFVVREGRVMYCSDCHRRLGLFVDREAVGKRISDGE